MGFIDLLIDSLNTAKSEITSLLTFANEKTGESDVNIGDAVRRLADGFGQVGGNDKFEEIDKYLLSLGFHRDEISIDNDKTSGTDGNYIRVNHTLGSKPNKAVMIPRNMDEYINTITYERGLPMYKSGYFGGVSTMFGVDNSNNRTIFIDKSPDNGSLASEVLKIIGIMAEYADYNFCNGATDSYVLIRAGTTVKTKLLKGNYYLYTINN